MGKQIKNDQGELIQLIKEGKTGQVWAKVKAVGAREIPDPVVRFLVFNKAFVSFDPYRNNNFIHFYKNFIKFHVTNEANAKQFKLTNNRAVINALKMQACSPSDDVPPLIQELMSFN